MSFSIGGKKTKFSGPILCRLVVNHTFDLTVLLINEALKISPHNKM